MLTLPHAVSLTGIRAGVPLIVSYTLVSMWTVHLLNALYLEYKRSKVTHPIPCLARHGPGNTAHTNLLSVLLGRLPAKSALFGPSQSAHHS